MKIQLICISILAIMIRQTFQQNTVSNNPTGINYNSCAPKLGSNFATKLADCYEDTSKATYDCCFVAVRNNKGETFAVCNSQFKATLGPTNDQAIASILKTQNLTLIANFCPSENLNKCSPSIGNKYPNSTADCFQDTSKSGYNCCYVTARLATGEDFRMCDLQVQGTKSASDKILTNAFTFLNSTLLSNTCPNGQEMISLSLKFLFAALIFILF